MKRILGTFNKRGSGQFIPCLPGAESLSDTYIAQEGQTQSVPQGDSPESIVVREVVGQTTPVGRSMLM